MKLLNSQWRESAREDQKYWIIKRFRAFEKTGDTYTLEADILDRRGVIKATVNGSIWLGAKSSKLKLRYTYPSEP
ncbi:MAG TPA: hypothetical protein VMY39_02065 [Planctomycetota bacterium]|nr:hypothetical protein [Planctomycetota bacterium]